MSEIDSFRTPSPSADNGFPRDKEDWHTTPSPITASLSSGFNDSSFPIVFYFVWVLMGVVALFMLSRIYILCRRRNAILVYHDDAMNPNTASTIHHQGYHRMHDGYHNNYRSNHRGGETTDTYTADLVRHENGCRGVGGAGTSGSSCPSGSSGGDT